MTAPKSESTEATESKASPPSENIIERIETWVEHNPSATDYWIETESEAGELLIAMAAVLRLNAKGIKEPGDRRLMRSIANDYIQHVQNSTALEHFRNMSDDDELKLYGVRMRARSLVLQ